VSTDPVRDTARGHDEATPARLLGGVIGVVGGAAGLIAVVLLIVWFAILK
jgi:hypothetical protein